jgi:hypothetical protein
MAEIIMLARIFLVSLLFLLPGCVKKIAGQQSTPSQPDIYAGFVGTWVGTSSHFKDRVETTTQSVRLVITENKKKTALKLSYTLGEKGQKNFRHWSHGLVLIPTVKEMIYTYDGEYIDEVYRAVGLDDFAKTGLGTFSVATMRIRDNGTHIVWVGIFNLDPDHFTYNWDTSTDGKQAERYEMTALKRELASHPVVPNP